MARLLVINRAGQAARFPRTAVSDVLRRASRLWPVKTKDKKLAVVLVGKSASQRLNRVYRAQDKPTNVLSFKSPSPDELGDIVICYKQACSEARSARQKTAERVGYLFAHGLLHLLGFDHQSKSQSARMDRAMNTLLKIKTK